MARKECRVYFVLRCNKVGDQSIGGAYLLLRTGYLIGRARAQFKDKRARIGAADFSSDDVGCGGGSGKATDEGAIAAVISCN